MKKILIADDHIIVRLGVSTAIKETLKTVEIVHAQTYDEVSAQACCGRHTESFRFWL